MRAKIARRRGMPEHVRKKFQLAVRRAVREGILQPQPCEVCGDSGFEQLPNGKLRRTIHAHHDDYNDPLRVRWLCRPHHGQWHARNEAVKPSSEVAGMSISEVYSYALWLWNVQHGSDRKQLAR